MAAAVAASIPFGIKIAHIHGGETTLGAIDNIYRHSISLSSYFHFVSAQPFANRVQSLLDNNFSNVYHIGSLSLENLQNLTLLTKEEFLNKWEIDLNNPSLLVTVHPETVEYNLNSIYCQEINQALDILSDKYQVIITMPNADTAGILFREAFLKLASLKSNIKIIENFGTQSYFTCMKYSQLMIGNTSSGIVEAATFKKYVLNLGDRQKGRLSGENVINIPFDSNMIVQKVNQYIQKEFLGENLYFKPNPSKAIIEVLKNEFTSIQ
jgi:GDP/UDP-N,N'-diacetylbacillosamine 2-epimerase (hydrolysing)